MRITENNTHDKCEVCGSPISKHCFWKLRESFKSLYICGECEYSLNKKWEKWRHKISEKRYRIKRFKDNTDLYFRYMFIGDVKVFNKWYKSKQKKYKLNK